MDATEVEVQKSRKTLAMLGLATKAARVLVVGCGNGAEAGLIAQTWGSDVVGIGFDDGRFDAALAAPARLIHMDAQSLDFEAASFDFVYSFHALEHIPDPRAALSEIHRVLAPGGAYLVGTPNKARLVGYVGSPEPLADKVRSNIHDYRMRLTGKWSNEAGAHAGFTSRELVALCSDLVGPSEDVSDEYYEALYASRGSQLRLIRRMRLTRVAYPAVYVRGVRR